MMHKLLSVQLILPFQLVMINIFLEVGGFMFKPGLLH